MNTSIVLPPQTPDWNIHHNVKHDTTNNRGDQLKLYDEYIGIDKWSGKLIVTFHSDRPQ